MGPASKISSKISSRCIGLVNEVVKLKSKKMVKEEMTGGKKEHGRKKDDYFILSGFLSINLLLKIFSFVIL